jgi:hypothetical protein
MAVSKDNYNKIYETLVGDGKDVVGLVAYSIYKQDKRDQIVEIKGRRAKNPSQSEMAGIERNCSNRIAAYKKAAKEELDALVSGVINDNKEQIFEQYFSKDYSHLQELKNIKTELASVKNNTEPRSFLAEMGIEVAGNIAWSILFILLSIIVYFNNDEIQAYKHKIGRALQEDTTKTNTDTTKSKQ